MNITIILLSSKFLNILNISNGNYEIIPVFIIILFLSPQFVSYFVTITAKVLPLVTLA